MDVGIIEFIWRIIGGSRSTLYSMNVKIKSLSWLVGMIFRYIFFSSPLTFTFPMAIRLIVLSSCYFNWRSGQKTRIMLTADRWSNRVLQSNENAHGFQIILTFVVLLDLLSGFRFTKKKESPTLTKTQQSEVYYTNLSMEIGRTGRSTY